MENGKRRPRRQLSPEEKWETFLEVTSQEISPGRRGPEVRGRRQRDPAAQGPPKDAAIVAFRAAKPGRRRRSPSSRSCCERRTIVSPKR